MPVVHGSSDEAGMAGVEGDNTADGAGVWGSARPAGRGVVGVSDRGVGVWGHIQNGGRAVVGAVNEDGAGVWGEVKTGRGVVGVANEDGAGVWGEVKTGRGVVGVVKEGSGAGVTGESPSDGVIGRGRRGVVGISPTYQGVYGQSDDNAGVVGESTKFHALFGISHAENNGGVFATNTHPDGFAGLFDGSVKISGSLNVQGLDVGNLLRRLQELLPILNALAAAEQHRPALQVTLVGREDAQANVRINGQRFRPNAWIKIQFRSTSVSDADRPVHTSPSGEIDSDIVHVYAPVGTSFEVTAVDETAPHGEITSNTVHLDT
jgi:hypothetical protein